MKLLLRHIAIYILLLFNLVAFSQAPKVDIFSSSDFLGEKDFMDITQDNNLIIYLLSSEGILSFDGVEFSKIKLEGFDEKINDIHHFNNSLYLSTSKGSYQFNLKDNSLTKLINDSVIEFQQVSDSLWLLTESELFVLKKSDAKIRQVYESKNKEKFKCFYLDNTRLIIGHSSGLSVLNPDNTTINFGSFLEAEKIKSNDSVLYILSNGIIYNLSGNKNSNSNITQMVKKESPIFDFNIDGYGNNWFVYEDQQLYLDNGVKTESLKNLTPNYKLNYTGLFRDQESNLWAFGENTLIKISFNNKFSLFNESLVKNIYFGENGSLVLKNNELIFYNLDFIKRTVKTPFDRITAKNIFSFEEKGDSWLVNYNKENFRYHALDNRLEKISINSQFQPLAKLSRDSIIAKTSTGDLYLLDAEFQAIQKIKNINAAHLFLYQQEQIIAINGSYLLSRINMGDGSSSSFHISDTINLNNLRIGRNGIWFFTDHQILAIDSLGKGNTTLTKKLNLKKDELILNVFDDFEESLWVSTQKGLYKIPYYQDSSLTKFRDPIRYTENDLETSSYFNLIKKSPNNLIWLANNRDFLIYNPIRELPNLTPPGIKIAAAFAVNLDEFNNPIDTVVINSNSINVDRKALIVIQPIVTNHRDNHLNSVSYRNISMNQSENIVPANEKIILTNLSDGMNTISLKGINSNRIESTDTANINVYINLPIWKKNWFYLTGALSLLLLGFIGYKTVISIKNNRAKELEDELHKGLEDLEKKSHLQVLKAERLKQLNDLITSQKSELEKKNKQIESQKYELSLTNQQIKQQKDLLEETSSKLKASINYAKRIQNALMSTEIEVKEAIDDSFVYFMPRDMVSGDFFWFNKVLNEKGEELLILAAVDCTGHGVPGAIVSVVGMNLLNNITNLKKISDPGQILTTLNSDIIHDLRQYETQVNDGMDMTIVTINKTTKQLYFAGAKNPLMYIEDEELIRIKGDKYAIGGQQRGDDRDFETHQLDLSDGKTRDFYMFSDGYQDQFGGEKGFKFLTSNFKKLLLDIHNKPVLDQKTIIHETLEDWKDGYSQTDDILVIGFRI